MKCEIFRLVQQIRIAVVMSVFMPLAFLSSCSPPDDAGMESNGYDISIAYLKSLYSGHPVDITADYRVRGYVVSTDRYGNFYKSVVVADSTAGIEIKVDMENIFRDLRFGDEVYLHCNGLTLGAYSGLIQLGAASSGGYETGYIGGDILTAYIQVTGQSPEAPQGSTISIPELSPRWLSCLVRIEDVQFVEEERGLLWCEPDADTDRHIIDRSGNTLTVRTSRYAEFASWLLPQGRGYIEGILSFFNGEYQLKLSDPRMHDMNGERF